MALKARDMNRDEAQELLSQLRTIDQYRRHDAQSGYDPSSQAGLGGAFPRFNHVAQQMSFPQVSFDNSTTYLSNFLWFLRF